MSNPNFEDKSGQRVPNVTFPIRVNDALRMKFLLEKRS